MAKKTLTVFIPALNEEKHIGNVIDEIPLKEIKKMGFDAEILVANGPSTDSTEKIAKGKGANVISVPKGKGNSVRKAFEYIESDYIIMLDADETYPGAFIVPILKELEKGFDVVLGSRLGGKIEKGAMSSTNVLGNKILTGFANFLFGSKISDMCTGYWGMNRKAVKGVQLSAEGFDIEANLLTECTKKGYRFSEINIEYRKRGDEAKLKAFDDGIKIGKRLFDLKFLTDKTLLKKNFTALALLLVLNAVVFWFFFERGLNLRHSFQFFGIEVMPLILSSAILVLVYGFMLYLMRGNFLAVLFSSIVYVFSTNFSFGFALIPLKEFFGLILFVLALSGIVLTFGKENNQRYVFAIISYAVLFFVNPSLFFVLFAVFLIYLAFEFKNLASKKFLTVWIVLSIALLAYITRFFSVNLSPINLLYYFSIVHFAVAVLGFYVSIFSRRQRVLVATMIFLMLLILLSDYASFSVPIALVSLINMVVFTIILLTGIGIERIVFYARTILREGKAYGN